MWESSVIQYLTPRSAAVNFKSTALALPITQNKNVLTIYTYHQVYKWYLKNSFLIYSSQGTLVIIFSIASPNILGLKSGKLPKFLTFSQPFKKKKKKKERGHQRGTACERLLVLLLDFSV